MMTRPIGYRKNVVLSRNGRTAAKYSIFYKEVHRNEVAAKSSKTKTYHHILESSGSDNKKLPPRRVDSIARLERSHVRPTEATENIEALEQETCHEILYKLQLTFKWTDIFVITYHIG